LPCRRPPPCERVLSGFGGADRVRRDRRERPRHGGRELDNWAERKTASAAPGLRAGRARLISGGLKREAQRAPGRASFGVVTATIHQMRDAAEVGDDETGCDGR